MTNDTGEKRRFSRVRFSTEATVIGAADRWRSQLVDVSLKGALIERPRGWHAQPGESFTLEIVLGAEPAVVIRMAVVTVAHVQPDHVGFKCLEIDLDSIAHLKRLLQLNLGDAELINREISELGHDRA